MAGNELKKKSEFFLAEIEKCISHYTSKKGYNLLNLVKSFYGIIIPSFSDSLSGIYTWVDYNNSSVGYEDGNIKNDLISVQSKIESLRQ